MIEPMSCTRHKTRVLFITSDASAVAGVGPCLADALENIDPARIEARVVYPKSKGNTPSIVPRLDRLGVPAIARPLGMWLPSPRSWGLRHALQLLMRQRSTTTWLAKEIERNHINLVYSNGLPCIDGALAARWTRVPHIWHLHEAVRGNSDLRRYLPAAVVVQIVKSLSDAVIVNSRALATEVGVTALGARMHVIHNGVEVLPLSGAASDEPYAALRRALDVPVASPIVLSVGSIVPRKGYDTLVKAARQVLRTVPDAVFLVAGAANPQYAMEISVLASREGVGNAIRFLGPRTDVSMLMSIADVLVHCALQETFGRVLIEAMAVGKPVVATRCGGPEEIVVDGETGFLTPVGDPNAIATRVLTVLMNPELGKAMGLSGRRRAEAEFSVLAYGARIADVIEAVYSRRCPATGAASEVHESAS